MACWFLRLMTPPAPRAASQSDRRRGRPSRRFELGFRAFQCCGPCDVFIRQFAKAVAQCSVGTIAGEAAATLGLFANRVHHQTHSQRGGSPSYEALSRRRLRLIAGNLGIVPALCPLCDSIPARQGGLGLVPASAILSPS